MLTIANTLSKLKTDYYVNPDCRVIDSCFQQTNSDRALMI